MYIVVEGYILYDINYVIFVVSKHKGFMGLKNGGGRRGRLCPGIYMLTLSSLLIIFFTSGIALLLFCLPFHQFLITTC